MIYLDNSATTRTLKSAAETAEKYMLDTFFNPSAAYSPAVEAERAVNGARARLAGALGVRSEELIYTSGGTESNNTAIFGALSPVRGGGRVIVSAAEHPSVYEAAKSLSGRFELVEAPLDPTGAVDAAALAALVTRETLLVCVMQVNNETGAVNDLASIYSAVKRAAPGAAVHVDGVQGFLKVPFDARRCDSYSVSGHKFHATKGVGALYVRKGQRFSGYLIGGGQERGLRSGTTNTPGIMGMDAALEWYLANLAENRRVMRECKARLAENLAGIPDAVVNGPAAAQGAPHILNYSFPGVRGEVLLHALEEKGIYLSTGSACSAHKKGGNRMLTAMGVTGERQTGAVRMSLCPFNTVQEMDTASQAIAEQVAFLRKFKRR